MMPLVLLFIAALAILTIPAEASIVLVRETLDLGPGTCVIYEDIRAPRLRTQPCQTQATRFEGFPPGTIFINNLRVRVAGPQPIEIPLSQGRYTVAFSPDDIGAVAMRPMERLFSLDSIPSVINYVNELTYGLFVGLINLALYATLFIRTRNPVVLTTGSVAILLANVALLGRVDLTALVLTSIVMGAALYYTLWKRELPW